MYVNRKFIYTRCLGTSLDILWLSLQWMVIASFKQIIQWSEQQQHSTSAPKMFSCAQQNAWMKSWCKSLREAIRNSSMQTHELRCRCTTNSKAFLALDPRILLSNSQWLLIFIICLAFTGFRIADRH